MRLHPREAPPGPRGAHVRRALGRAGPGWPPPPEAPGAPAGGHLLHRPRPVRRGRRFEVAQRTVTPAVERRAEASRPASPRWKTASTRSSRCSAGGWAASPSGPQGFVANPSDNPTIIAGHAEGGGTSASGQWVARAAYEISKLERERGELEGARRLARARSARVVEGHSPRAAPTPQRQATLGRDGRGPREPDAGGRKRALGPGARRLASALRGVVGRCTDLGTCAAGAVRYLLAQAGASSQPRSRPWRRSVDGARRSSAYRRPRAPHRIHAADGPHGIFAPDSLAVRVSPSPLYLGCGGPGREPAPPSFT